MKDRTNRSLLRSVALVGAMAATATAFGNFEWTGGADTSTDEWRANDGEWSVSSNWLGEDGNYVFSWRSSGKTVTFTEMSYVDTGVWVENADDAMTFTGESSDVGLKLTTGDMHVGGINRGILNITGGGYTFPNLYLAYSQLHWENANPTGEGYLTVSGGEVVVTGTTTLGNIEGSASTLTLTGGMFTSPTVTTGKGAGTLTLNGGTLSAESVSGVAFVVGANGGTFDVGETDATVSAALTGSGTLTVTGNAILNLTGDVSAFKGKIVNNSTSYVILGEGAEAPFIEPGKTKDFDPQATYTVWSEDFEGDTAPQGWTTVGGGCGQEIRTRILANGVPSDYYLFWAQKSGGKSSRVVTATYELNLEDADVYTFEFDVYPKSAWNDSNTLTLTGVKTVVADDGEGNATATETTVTLATMVAQNPGNNNPGNFNITAGNVTGSVTMDARNDDNTTGDTSTRWYHVVISGNKEANKTYLQLLDRSGAVKIERAEIGEFAKVAGLSLTLRTLNNSTVFGIDNMAYKILAPTGIPADPVITVTPDSYAGDRVVTITCEDEDATIYWRDADGEFAEYTEPIPVSASTSIYAYTQNSAGQSENVVAVPVYANVKLNAPSVARRGWYRMKITPGAAPVPNETPEYVYHYYFSGHDEEETNSYVDPNNGTTAAGHTKNFNKDGTTFWAFMAADGYISSDKTNYKAYTFAAEEYKSLVDIDFYQHNGNTQFYDTDEDGNTITVELNGKTYRGVRTVTNQTYLSDDAHMLFSNETNGNYTRWIPSSGGALHLNYINGSYNGSILFKDVKPGTLVYVNSQIEPWGLYNLTRDTSYANTDEYVYVVDDAADEETGLVNATLSITGNTDIYCIKIYEPIPETTDTFVADDATLVDGAFTVPEGTTTITLGGVDVTKGFYIDENEPTKAKLLSPWFRWESAEEFGEGMVIDDDTVTLDIDLVPGLYYGPASATSLEALARPPTLVKYDGTNGDAIKKIEKPDGDTAFFTIYVDVKESETTTVTTEAGNGDDQG